MGPNALSSLVDGLHASSPAVVRSRGGGSWCPEAGRFGDEVRELAAALTAYGLRAGQSVAVLGSEGTDTLRADLAVLAAGATLLPLDPSISDEALRRALDATGAVQAIAADEKQLARILTLRPDLPSLELLLLMAAAPSERKPAAMLVAAAVQAGAAFLRDDPECLARTYAEGDGKSTCMLVGIPEERKPVARNMLAAVAAVIADTVGIGRSKSVLLALPVRGADRLGAALAVLGAGGTILIPDPAERPDAGVDAHAPDAVLLTVAGLERLHRAWVEDIEGKSWLRRRLTRWALRRGLDRQPKGWKHRLADALVLRGLREKLGGKLEAIYVIATLRGGASPDTDAFFKAVGLPVRYFQPEKGVPLAR